MTTRRKTNKSAILIHDYIVIYERSKNDRNGNPRYNVEVIKTTDTTRSTEGTHAAVYCYTCGGYFAGPADLAQQAIRLYNNHM